MYNCLQKNKDETCSKEQVTIIQDSLQQAYMKMNQEAFIEKEIASEEYKENGRWRIIQDEE